MAARTITHVLMNNPPGAVHAGVNALVFNVNSGATKFGTVSDVYLLGTIPNGATLVGGGISFGAQTSAASTFTLLLLSNEGAGTYSVLATLAATQGSITAGVAGTNFTIGNAGYRVSYSDDRAIRYATLALNCTVGASETVSFAFAGYLNYVADNRQL